MNGIGNPSTEFVKQIVRDIERVKADPAKERAYMDMQMKLMKAKEHGIEQGIEEGIDKGMHLGFMKANFDIALKMASLDQAAGLSEQEIASKLRMIFNDLDEDQFQQIISQLKK